MPFKKHLTNSRAFGLSILLLSGFFSSLNSFAYSSEGVSGWSWSAYLGNLNIDSTVARDQYLGDSAVILGFGAERFTDTSEFTLTLGMDFIFYDDKGDFSQLTNQGRKSSDASAVLAFVEFGPKLHFGLDNANFFIAHGGFSGIFASERGIGNCSNCYSEDIDVEGGAYGLIGIGHEFNSFELSLQFQQYFTGDLDNSLRIKIASVF
jgi:hypothetical protein